MYDPFKIDGPTCLSFSFGRSSAFMLKRVLAANGGRLPPETVVLACNTGKENKASLRFGARISQEWSVPITLLEYREGGQFEVVTFDTASLNGEPFEAVIHDRGGILPNPVSRYCSSEMKTRTMHRYIRQVLGWTEWETMLGIRADEPKRVASFRFNPHPETKDEYVRIPLADAFVSAQEVGAFWQAQPFDLELPNIGGKTAHGNCTRCFLKTLGTVVSLEKEEHDPWWAEQELRAEQVATGAGCRFRAGRPSYKQIAIFVRDQRDMFDPEETEAPGCLCGD
ncbi:MAG: Nin-like protein [Burkholderiales bacterium]|nr:Nin-like protein [Burkholderiales bacterium]